MLNAVTLFRQKHRTGGCNDYINVDLVRLFLEAAGNGADTQFYGGQAVHSNQQGSHEPGRD